MINVKGTQNAPQNPDPAAAYAPAPAKPAKGVARVGVAFLAVVLYLKAFLRGRAEAAEAEPAGAAPEDDGGAPKMLVIQGGRQQQDQPERAPPEPVESAVFGFSPGADTIAFPGPERLSISPVFQPAGYVAGQANENQPPAPGAARPPGLPAPAAAADAMPAAGGAGPDHSVTPEATRPAVVQPGDTATDDDDDDDDTTPNPTNRGPRVAGPVHLNDISACAILVFGLAELLRGANDPDGDLLYVRDITSSSGTLTMTGTDTWQFAPEGKLGPVTITYMISDGGLATVQMLHFTVTPGLQITGTEGDDILLGSMCGDVIEAGAGDDIVDALAGADLIRGGLGNDHIRAGAGDDLVYGGAGADVIFGGLGHDELFGEGGHDRLFGEEGNDTILGGSGDDMLYGGDGADVLLGEAGADLVEGGEGADEISGGEGDDRLRGEAGHDMIFGDGGHDVIDAGSGDDLVLAGSGDDVVGGGDGDDRLSGGEGDDLLDGGAGRDILLGEEGDDTIEDGAGEDIVDGGAGDDRVIAAADGADDHFAGGEGLDRLDYSAAEAGVEIDLVAGQARGIEIGEDSISGFEIVLAGAGNDVIRFGGQSAAMSGGAGQNTFEADAVAIVEALHSEEGQQTSFYQIGDFKVGDVLRMSKWEIFEEVYDEFEDRFEQLYGGHPEEEDVPIRFRNELSEAMHKTIIEADLDSDDFYETAIVLDGRHVLVFVETV